ncbi:DUF6187 family protein [Actinophytocola oryzae]|uniref:Uncharacterized protein n=1 Tax=Actinophytocola oryzae TaxID=502181 RepID=A0A4R7UYC1_9PSEU|nr:DUF6187 family protein [Actinophytocola oryzae]TDV41082.1 hypothetical protein CLV71_121148 [Actinophytocola oryzae]
MTEQYDTIFGLPSVDDEPDTEVGVLLMGLGPERLLAGLGVACRDPVADPAAVTLVVDQLRHGARQAGEYERVIADGVTRWRAASAGIARAGLHPGPRSAALRRLWTNAASALADADGVDGLRTAGAGERVYLTACWLRPEEINRMTEENGGTSALPA